MHIEKFKATAIGHMCSHYDRSQNVLSNIDIDKSKTKENYNLCHVQPIKQSEFVRNKVEEIGVRTKSTVLMCTWIVTLPKNVRAEDEELFFQKAYEFLANRYGEQNVVSAYVHKDEVTPHMHFAFCPIVYDKEKKKNKFCAKELITRTELRTIHGDMDAYIEKELGYNCGVQNGATKEGNLSVAELRMLEEKREQMEQELKSIKPDEENIKQINWNLRRQNALLKMEVDAKRRKDMREGVRNERYRRSNSRCRVRNNQGVRVGIERERQSDIRTSMSVDRTGR